jgi:hypothetical protein
MGGGVGCAVAGGEKWVYMEWETLSGRASLQYYAHGRVQARAEYESDFYRCTPVLACNRLGDVCNGGKNSLTKRQFFAILNVIFAGNSLRQGWQVVLSYCVFCRYFIAEETMKKWLSYIGKLRIISGRKLFCPPPFPCKERRVDRL